MAASSRNPTHEERTASEPRQDGLQPVRLTHIQQVNDKIRVLRLKVLQKVKQGIQVRESSH